jgi:hypothetical protein
LRELVCILDSTATGRSLLRPRITDDTPPPPPPKKLNEPYAKEAKVECVVEVCGNTHRIFEANTQTFFHVQLKEVSGLQNCKFV